MTNVPIRPYVASDAAAVTAIYGHYVEHSTATFDTEAPGEAAMAAKFAELIRLGYPVLVAEGGGRMLGYAYLSAYRPRPAYRFTCENTVYCAPDAQRMGVGRALLSQLIDRARADGLRQMIAVISDDGGGSIPLHETFGFAVAGRFPQVGFKFDRWLDVVHMQLAL